MNKDRNSGTSHDKDEKVGYQEISESERQEILNRPGIQEVLNVHQGWKIDTGKKPDLLDMSELTEEEIEFLNRPGIQEVLNVHQGWKIDTV